MTPYDPVHRAAIEADAVATAPPAATVATTSSSPDRREVARPLSSRFGAITARAWLVDLTAVGVLALVMRALFTHALPLGDPAYALVWGRDLAEGRLPDLSFGLAPTAHPLALVESAAASVVGHQGAIDALLIVSYLCLGALLWGVYRLGEAAFSRLTGAAAVVIVASSPTLITAAVEAYLDLPYLALIVWAAVLEARRPRRGLPVLIALSLAGLLRPEAWVLAGAYWLYAGGTGARRWTSALAVLAAPAGWLLMGLIVTGDPLYALSAQQHVASVRLGHVAIAPSRYASAALDQLRLAIHAVVLAGALPGFVLAAIVRRRAALVPIAILILIMATYVAFIVVGVAIPDRMLLAPAVMLALFCSYALCGWGHARATPRLAWAALGLMLLVGLIAATPKAVSDLSSRSGRWSTQMRALTDLKPLSTAPRSRAALANCRSVWFTEPLVAQAASPYLSYDLRRPLTTNQVAGTGTPKTGAYVVPRREVASVLVFENQIAQATRVPRGFSLVAQNRSWVLYAKGC